MSLQHLLRRGLLRGTNGYVYPEDVDPRRGPIAPAFPNLAAGREPGRNRPSGVDNSITAPELTSSGPTTRHQRHHVPAGSRPGRLEDDDLYANIVVTWPKDDL